MEDKVLKHFLKFTQQTFYKDEDYKDEGDTLCQTYGLVNNNVSYWKLGSDCGRSLPTCSTNVCWVISTKYYFNIYFSAACSSFS